MKAEHGEVMVPEGEDEDGEGDEDGERNEVQVHPPPTPCFTPCRVAAKSRQERLSGLPQGSRCPLVSPSLLTGPRPHKPIFFLHQQGSLHPSLGYAPTFPVPNYETWGGEGGVAQACCQRRRPALAASAGRSHVPPAQAH